MRDEKAKLQTVSQNLNHQDESNASRILELRLYSRNANLEVKGAPVQADEDMTAMLKTLGEATGKTILVDDTEICHRYSVARNPSETNIVTQFVRRVKRNSVLGKVRSVRLTTRDLRLSTQVPVYVNEHLCPELKLQQQTT